MMIMMLVVKCNGTAEASVIKFSCHVRERWVGCRHMRHGEWRNDVVLLFANACLMALLQYIHAELDGWSVTGHWRRDSDTGCWCGARKYAKILFSWGWIMSERKKTWRYKRTEFICRNSSVFHAPASTASIIEQSLMTLLVGVIWSSKVRLPSIVFRNVLMPFHHVVGIYSNSWWWSLVITVDVPAINWFHRKVVIINFPNGEDNLISLMICFKFIIPSSQCRCGSAKPKREYGAYRSASGVCLLRPSKGNIADDKRCDSRARSSGDAWWPWRR